MRYTNACLYYAIKESLVEPYICLAPVSEFYTFSGQVIAAVKIYRECGKRGAFIDLQGNYSNSNFEDLRSFVPDLIEAIPEEFNINPVGYGESYIESLTQSLYKLEKGIWEGKIDYLVWSNGTDNSGDDNRQGPLTAEQWIRCSKVFYSWVKELGKKKGPIPITILLLDGYSSNHYESVLSLHSADLVECLNTLCHKRINYQPSVNLNFKSK